MEEGIQGKGITAANLGVEKKILETAWTWITAASQPSEQQVSCSQMKLTAFLAL